MECPLWVKSRHEALGRDVRFAPESGYRLDHRRRPLRANSDIASTRSPHLGAGSLERNKRTTHDPYIDGAGEGAGEDVVARTLRVQGGSANAAPFAGDGASRVRIRRTKDDVEKVADLLRRHASNPEENDIPRDLAEWLAEGLEKFAAGDARHIDTALKLERKTVHDETIIAAWALYMRGVGWNDIAAEVKWSGTAESLRVEVNRYSEYADIAGRAEGRSVK